MECMMWKSLQLLFIQSIRCQWRYNYLPPVKSFKHFSWPSTFGIGLVKNVWMELRSWWWAFTIICNVCYRTTLARQFKSFHPDLNHNDSSTRTCVLHSPVSLLGQLNHFAHSWQCNSAFGADVCDSFHLLKRSSQKKRIHTDTATRTK